MALVLKKFSSIFTQIFVRAFEFKALLIRGLPLYTASNVKSNENDKRLQEKNVDRQEKNEKKSKEDQVLASMVVRSRSPQKPKPSPGTGPQTN